MLLTATALVAAAVSAATGDTATTATPLTTKMSPLAEQLHGYGRPGFTFQKSPDGHDQFPLTTTTTGTQYRDDYLEAMATLALVVVAVPTVLVIFLYLWWMMRCCCCKPKPAVPASKCLRMSTFFSFVTCFIVLLGVASGAKRLKDGADMFPGSHTEIVIKLDYLDNLAVQFKQNSIDMRACKQPSSTSTDPLNALIDSFADAALSVHTAIDGAGFSGLKNEMEEPFDEFAEQMKMISDISVAGTLALWAIVVLFAVWGICSRGECKYNTAKTIAFVVFLAMAVVCAVCLMISLFLADYCVGDPRAYLIDELLRSDTPDTQDFLTYYFTCKGQSPFQNESDEVEKTLADLMASANDACLTSATTQAQALKADLLNQLSCKLVDDFLTTIIDNAVCTEFIEGFFYLWCLVGSASLGFWFLFLSTTCKESALFAPAQESYEYDDGYDYNGGPKSSGQPVQIVNLERTIDANYNI